MEAACTAGLQILGSGSIPGPELSENGSGGGGGGGDPSGGGGGGGDPSGGGGGGGDPSGGGGGGGDPSGGGGGGGDPSGGGGGGGDPSGGGGGGGDPSGGGGGGGDPSGGGGGGGDPSGGGGGGGDPSGGGGGGGAGGGGGGGVHADSPPLLPPLPVFPPPEAANRNTNRTHSIPTMAARIRGRLLELELRVSESLLCSIYESVLMTGDSRLASIEAAAEHQIQGELTLLEADLTTR